MDKPALIINLKAKNAHSVSDYTAGFKGAGISYRLYEIEPDQIVDCIKQCIKKHSILLIGGGDGTVRTAAQCCANTPIILGVVALGTLNHFAKELGLPLTVQELIDAVNQCQTSHIDLAEVNGLIFVNNSSLGFYPKFARERDVYTKKLSKWLSYIPSLIQSFRKHDVFTLSVKSKNLNLSFKTSFLMISNNIYSYEFPATIKRESFTKSLLGLYYYKNGRIYLCKLLGALFNKKSNFEIKKSKYPIELHFNKSEHVTISLDGDTVKVKPPLHYKILPKSLTILIKASCA